VVIETGDSQMTKTITTVIIHKLPVLAATTKIGTFAKTFANRTQAENAAAKVGGYVVQWNRPFFVVVEG